jgi:adenine-specific DNA-methyltransferase
MRQFGGQDGGMNYIGSKVRLTGFIRDTVRETAGSLAGRTFCDLFAGTAAVAKAFKTESGRTIANDIEPFSYVLCRNAIGNRTSFDAASLINELNALPGEEGFVFRNYCPGGGSGRLYWSDENGRRIDAARHAIEDWKLSGRLTEDVYYFLLASLIESADRHANTASVYGAFLKRLKASALRPIRIEPSPFEPTENAVEVYRRDANELVREISGDVLYLDPPYNGRHYGANYHLLNTIALNDRFEPRGRTGLRDYYRSPYCGKRTVRESLTDLIANARFRWIYLSYNNEGLLSFEETRTLLSRFGRWDCVRREHTRFKADSDGNRIHKANATIEYLHIIEKVIL